MTRKRAWEIGATATLALVLAGTAGVAFTWQQRQQRLNRALAEAVDGCRLARVMPLVRQGANVNTVGDQGFTALLVAAGERDVLLVRELLDYGAAVDARPQCRSSSASERDRLNTTPLLLAAGYERRRPIWRLVNGAMVDEPDWWLPTEAAAHTRIARRLITRGADVNAVGGSGQTPLTCAATVGNQPLVQLLLDHGADPNLRIQGYRTALQCARRPGIIRLLRQRGAKQ